MWNTQYLNGPGFFFFPLGRLINGIKVAVTTLSPSHISIYIHTHKHAPLPLIYIYIFTYTPTDNSYWEKCKYGGHIHKRNKQNKVDLISNMMSPTPKRKKKLLLPYYTKSHRAWRGRIPNWILATYGLPEPPPPPQGRCSSSSSRWAPKKESKCLCVCVHQQQVCRTSPHGTKESLIIMQSWMHGVSPKCPKERSSSMILRSFSLFKKRW